VADATLEGTRTEGVMILRVSSGHKAAGNIYLAGIDRSVRFEGVVKPAGRFAAKIDTEDGLKGRIRGTLKDGKVHGDGSVFIPEMASTAALEFSLREPPAGKFDRSEHSYVVTSFDNVQGTSKAAFPITRLTARVTTTYVPALKKFFYVLDTQIDFKPEFAKSNVLTARQNGYIATDDLAATGSAPFRLWINGSDASFDYRISARGLANPKAPADYSVALTFGPYSLKASGRAIEQ